MLWPTNFKTVALTDPQAELENSLECCYGDVSENEQRPKKPLRRTVAKSSSGF